MAKAFVFNSLIFFFYCGIKTVVPLPKGVLLHQCWTLSALEVNTKVIYIYDGYNIHVYTVHELVKTI